MWLRTLLVQVLWRTRGPLGLHDVGRMPMRVRPTDVDVLRHVNNGVYLSLMDLGRWDLLLRAGAWQRLVAARVYPVVASSTVTYRRSLQPGQRFVLETRIIGYDERSVYVEQRFVVDGEVFVRGTVRGRFLRRGGGVVAIAEVAELLGVDVRDRQVEPWLADWAERVALPSSRAAAPSLWS